MTMTSLPISEAKVALAFQARKSKTHAQKGAFRREMLAPISEADLLASVIDLAHTFGWKAQHIRPARLENGQWRTAVQGDKGGPDLILARAGMIILVELKSETGKLTREQEEWRDEGVITWRPSQWLSDEILKVLR